MLATAILTGRTPSIHGTPQLSTTGTNSNDILIGTNSNENISGGNGNDTISGGGGADTLSGGNGNDVLDGGSGSDVLFGNNGDDTAVYVAVDNLTAHDVYEGGNGTDTLVLKLTATQLNEMNASTVFADFRAAAGSSTAFDFSAYGFGFNIRLTAGGFERIQTVLIADPAAPTAHADVNAITEDAESSTITGNLLANDAPGGIADATLAVTNAGMLGGLYGTLTLNPDGTYSYLLDQANAALAELNDGDMLQETFAYTITDGYGQATSQLTITINGHTDLPPLFTAGDDVVDFNTVVAGSYRAGTQYDALDGNDTVILPGSAAEAAAAGFAAGTAFRTGDGQNTVIGGGLNDIVVGGNGSDTIDGGAGNDTLSGGGGNDVIAGGRGNDLIDGGAGIDTYVMTTATFVFLADGNAVDGEGGVDQIVNIENVIGSDFDDRIFGDAQDNAFFGGGGRDVIEGGAGNDRLDGGLGRDRLLGGDGDDLFISDAIQSAIFGGDGIDTIDYSGVLFDMAINFHMGFAGEAPIRTVYPIDYPFLPDSFSGIENIIAGQGNDHIIGDERDNRITGFLGDDTMGGMVGRDVFHFDLGGGANVGNDIILDFEIGIDHISLGGGLHADLNDLNPHQVGEDTVLDLGPGMQLTLLRTNAALLTDSDFLF